MKYFAILLRILIIVTGVHMLYLSEWTTNTPPFCSGIAIILIGVYLSLQAMIGPKAMLCPFTEGCRKKMGCKSEK